VISSNWDWRRKTKSRRPVAFNMTGTEMGLRSGKLDAVLLLIAWGTAGAYAQTAVDLRTQSKSVDFSGASSTKPAKVGTTLPAVCVAGEAFFKLDAAPGHNWYGCSEANVWVLQGDGVGATSVAQLTDFQVIQTSSNVLTIGDACTALAPCAVRFGSAVYSIVQGATVTLNSGTGTARIYLTPNGQVTVAHDLNVTCSAGCVALSGVTAFPAGSVPLWTWTAAAGAWDAAGGNDRRALLSGKVVIAGAGLTGLDSGGQTVLSLDSAVIGSRVAVPASPSSACTSGSWAADSSNYYMCYTTNNWRRAALSSW